MNSHIANCLEPQPGSFTSTLRADAHPHTHASSGWGGAPLYIHVSTIGTPKARVAAVAQVRRVLWEFAGLSAVERYLPQTGQSSCASGIASWRPWVWAS